MAGDYTGPGHRIVSGEVPVVGLRVLNNDLKWGVIVRVEDPDGLVTCGWYCEAWHEVVVDGTVPHNGRLRTEIFNCDRLTTKWPPGLKAPN